VLALVDVLARESNIKEALELWEPSQLQLGQPAVTEHSRPSQLQTTQLHLHAVHGIGRNLPIARK
jgi:hypothetical protein